jgi:SAM-dependent methyltransferase
MISLRSIEAYRAFQKESGMHSLPSASLRYRVDGFNDMCTFLAVGRNCVNDIQLALKKNNIDLNSFRDILDFGCGCGRTLMHIPLLVKNFGGYHFYGTDIDAKAISWCRANIKFVKFDTNSVLPPLRYPSEFFDFIYAISVLTHLKEELQFLWLEELKRVMKPGGVLLLSVHGRGAWENYSKEFVNGMEIKGFVFKQTPRWNGVFPKRYQTAYHTEQYVRDNFKKYFKVVDYIPRGINNHQDLVVLRKPG